MNEMIALNPITMKELRIRMRGLRAILPIISYLAVLGIFILIRLSDFSREMEYSQMANRGHELGFILLYIQLFLVFLLAPAYAASAITTEKERDTFGVMQTTLITSWEIVTGKVFSGFGYASLLVVSSLPLLSLAFWMGGFETVHILWGFLIIISFGFLVTAIGIFLSTLLSRSYVATGATYGTIIAGFVLGLIFKTLTDNYYLAVHRPITSFSWETIPYWLCYSLNPFTMLQSVDMNQTGFYKTNNFYYNNPVIDGLEYLLNSAGLPYMIMYVVLSLLLSIILLRFAAVLLFRTSREDNP